MKLGLSASSNLFYYAARSGYFWAVSDSLDFKCLVKILFAVNFFQKCTVKNENVNCNSLLMITQSTATYPQLITHKWCHPSGSGGLQQKFKSIDDDTSSLTPICATISQKL